MLDGLSRPERSPLTETEVAAIGYDSQGVVLFCDECGKWAAATDVLEDILNENFSSYSYDFGSPCPRIDVLKSIMRSMTYKAHLNGARPPLFIKNKRLREVANGMVEIPYDFREFHLRGIENAYEDARALRLEEKALDSLSLMAAHEEVKGAGVALPIDARSFPIKIRAAHDKCLPAWKVLYGCVNGEDSVVLSLLAERDWIRFGDREASFTSSNADTSAAAYLYTPTYITASGYLKLEDFEKGKTDATRRCFLICRFTHTLDALFDSVYSTVGRSSEVRCPIHRVKDVHHVDRIDDRILREIEAATLIIVDLTDENFNIGFEAGYALALRKPIVWTLNNSSWPDKLPFDIQSQNVLGYDDENLLDFKEALKYRMLAAIEKANLS